MTLEKSCVLVCGPVLLDRSHEQPKGVLHITAPAWSNVLPLPFNPFLPRFICELYSSLPTLID